MKHVTVFICSTNRCQAFRFVSGLSVSAKGEERIHYLDEVRPSNELQGRGTVSRETRPAVHDASNARASTKQKRRGNRMIEGLDLSGALDSAKAVFDGSPPEKCLPFGAAGPHDTYGNSNVGRCVRAAGRSNCEATPRHTPLNNRTTRRRDTGDTGDTLDSAPGHRKWWAFRLVYISLIPARLT